MIAVEEILAKLSGKTFSELEPEEQRMAGSVLRPQPGQSFTVEQYRLMQNWYLVVPPSRLEELKQLNCGKGAIAQPVFLADGTKVLGAGLLSDCRPGETFAHLREFLFSLKFRQVGTNEWPQLKFKMP